MTSLSAPHLKSTTAAITQLVSAKVGYYILHGINIIETSHSIHITLMTGIESFPHLSIYLRALLDLNSLIVLFVYFYTYFFILFCLSSLVAILNKDAFIDTEISQFLKSSLCLHACL